MTTTGINLAASETVSAQNPLSADAAVHRHLRPGERRQVEGCPRALRHPEWQRDTVELRPHYDLRPPRS
jgi:hypothetical protein